jgi:hypothetical protein
VEISEAAFGYAMAWLMAASAASAVAMKGHSALEDEVGDEQR